MHLHTLDREFTPDPALRRHGYPTPGPQSPTGSEVLQDAFFLTDVQWQQAADKQYNVVIIGTSFCALAFATKALERRPDCKILLLERGPFFLPSHFQALPAAFADTLGGKSETFPWTVDRRTEMGEDGPHVRASHGSVPFFGGRSTVWSTWCPCPTPEEMHDWPGDVIDAAHRHFDFAKKLLRVQSADQVYQHMAPGGAEFSLQSTVQAALVNAKPELPQGIDRVEAARLASADADISGIDFLKYSVPGSLLELKKKFPKQLDIKLDCTVRRIVNQQGYATALDTSAGMLPLTADAALVLAMGALPPTTLVQNSFEELREEAGKTFSAHFISSVVARVPREVLLPQNDESHQVGACYISGVADGIDGKGSYGQQFHIQLSMIMDKDPKAHASTLLRYMPDVVATASPDQLRTSTKHVVLVCAVLGELDVKGNSSFRANPADPDPTTNSMLRVCSDGKADVDTWNAMDEATFAVLEALGKAQDEQHIEYWHGLPGEGEWRTSRPPQEQIRVPDLVHESSTLPISQHEGALVGTDYKLKGTKNVYVTGAGLWPRGGSWNPTLTMVALAADLAERVPLGPAR